MAKIRTITTKSHFAQIYAGKRFVGENVVLFANSTQGKGAFAFVASKKVGKAVVRNRAKRLMRAALVSLINWQLVEHGVILLARRGIEKSRFTKIQQDIAKGLAKIANISGGNVGYV